MLRSCNAQTINIIVAIDIKSITSYCVMPKQVFNKEDFLKMADGATECLVVRRKDKVKLKLRKSRMMYIYVTNEPEANDLLKSIKAETIEF